MKNKKEEKIAPEEKIETPGETNKENTDAKNKVENNEANDKAKKEKSPVDELKSKNDELNDKLLRLVAEYDNYRKRTQKEKSEIYPQAISDTVEKLLPIIDNFERAMDCECKDAEFFKGIEMTYNMLMNVMTSLSVEAVGAVGDAFNPDMHNAVSHIEDEALGENVVSVVMQKGYKIGERVIRYAMVQVAN